MPAIDCVEFADPKQSLIDIVQAAGRALRLHHGKDCGYLLLPLIVPSNMDFEEFADTTAFKQVARTITALSIQDERIAEEFRAIEKGRISSGKVVEIEGDVPVGMKIKLNDFAEAISTRIWDRVARANPRSFSDARLFVHRLNLKSYSEWVAYRRSDKKPPDIPSNPNRLYANIGWAGYGDWLGTGIIAPRLRQYRPFQEARTFVHKLHLKSYNEWKMYCASGEKPADIPVAPDQLYADTGWAGFGDWLGTGTVAPFLRRYRPFKKARAFVRSLHLNSAEQWRAYCKSGKLPPDIPAHPFEVYSDKGWESFGDWLGTGKLATHLREYRSFTEAREFARSLRLKSGSEWKAYCKSGKLPSDIPADVYSVYANKGWAGFGDWLGTGKRRRGAAYRPFKEARAFARRLGLKSEAEWIAYCRSGILPHDIPSKPYRTYANSGWLGFGDWLGTGRVANQLRQYQTFKKARAFVRTLELKSNDQWRDYCRSGNRPNDIPAAPERNYSKDGWAGWGDWLGTGRLRLKS